MKRCSCCKKILSLENFGKHRRMKNGLRSSCKKCVNQQNNKYCKENVDRRKLIVKKSYYKNIINIQKYRSSLRGRDTRSNRHYKISISDMLEWQDYKCAVCGEKENGKKLSVDHNHQTRQVRMLLCHTCNTRLIATIESPLYKVALEYLKSFDFSQSV